MGSVVVGDCADCIVSVTSVPVTTLALELKLTVGRNLIRSLASKVYAVYDADTGYIQQTVEIPGTASYALPTGCSFLALSTNGPVNVAITNTAGSLTLPVTNQLTLDAPLTAAQLVNPNTDNTTAIKVTLLYIPTPVPV